MSYVGCGGFSGMRHRTAGRLKARNLLRDPRVALSITDRERPFPMATVRGGVVERLEGDPAWGVIDRIAHKYTGRPRPRRERRTVLLVDPRLQWAQGF